jgi:hypothetical protein
MEVEEPLYSETCFHGIFNTLMLFTMLQDGLRSELIEVCITFCDRCRLVVVVDYELY